MILGDCSHCGRTAASMAPVKEGLCWSCYKYSRRHGQLPVFRTCTTPGCTDRIPPRYLKSKWCSHCKQGYEARRERMLREDCSNCFRKLRYKPDGYNASLKLCYTCNTYRRVMGRMRPSDKLDEA